jgi:branched-chain amino acid aminotransferase
MRIYNMPITFSQKQLEDAVVDVVRQNNLGDAYIRMIAFYASGNVTFSTPGDVSIAIAPMALKQYFNKDSLTCVVSSWRRIDSSILPPHGKTTGHYANSVLATMDAKAAGVDEAIMLDRNGYVAEGSAQNIFLLKKGVVVTPSTESDILMGITRDTVLTLLHDNNIPYEERLVHKEELYTADELFFTGTATGIVPITKVDGRPIPLGDISIGVKELYRRITKGELEQYKYWLTYV